MTELRLILATPALVAFDKPLVAAVNGLATGIAVCGEAWSGGGVPEVPDGGFRYVEIPVDAVPEAALERLSALRQ